MNNLFLASLFLFACGAPSTNEDAEIAALQPDAVGKADAVTLGGAFEIVADTLSADDLVYVNLLPSGKWVWQRCYDTPCSQLIPQDGTFTLYKSASGRKYIKFFTTHVGSPPTPPPGDLVDLYAYTLHDTTLKLRKANTSRVFDMTAFSDEAACNQSGGNWDGAATCDCSALGTGAFGSAAYLQPGLGGCTLQPVSSEAMCDGTQGAYTDDDNNLVGSYCECGVGRYFADGTGCSDVPR